MRAATIERAGQPYDLLIGEIPRPAPGPGQLLIRVKAASVNPIDTYVCSGAVAAELPLPFIPGSDFAGAVEAVGQGVSGFSPGDRVWGANQGIAGRQGTLAEWIAVDACWAHPIPEGVSEETAAASAVTGLTAWLGLVRRAGLRAGETVLIQGGSGGVGSMAVQIAKALGARVIATAGSPEKREACRALGADAALDHTSPDLAGEILEAAPGGVDVWWEARREPDFDLIVGSLARFGRAVVLAGRSARPELPVGPFYVKAASLLGHVLFAFDPETQREAAREINRLLASGQLVPRIDSVFPLEQAAEAHALQWRSTVERSGELSGKIVIGMGGTR